MEFVCPEQKQAKASISINPPKDKQKWGDPCGFFFEPNNNSEELHYKNWKDFQLSLQNRKKSVTNRMVALGASLKKHVFNGASLKICLFLRSSSFPPVFLETSIPPSGDPDPAKGG